MLHARYSTTTYNLGLSLYRLINNHSAFVFLSALTNLPIRRNAYAGTSVSSIPLYATMVTSQNAYELAKFYSKNMGEVLPDIYFDVKLGREFKDFFYFDFIMVDKLGNPPKELPMAGGAPGVIVNKLTGIVETISFGELSNLK